MSFITKHLSAFKTAAESFIPDGMPKSMNRMESETREHSTYPIPPDSKIINLSYIPDNEFLYFLIELIKFLISKQLKRLDQRYVVDMDYTGTRSDKIYNWRINELTLLIYRFDKMLCFDNPMWYSEVFSAVEEYLHFSHSHGYPWAKQSLDNLSKYENYKDFHDKHAYETQKICKFTNINELINNEHVILHFGTYNKPPLLKPRQPMPSPGWDIYDPLTGKIIKDYRRELRSKIKGGYKKSRRHMKKSRKSRKSRGRKTRRQRGGTGQCSNAARLDLFPYRIQT